MVNKVIFDYLNQYSGKYGLSEVKKKILSSGYSQEEVDEAIRVLGLVDEDNSSNNNSFEDNPNFNKLVVQDFSSPEKGIRWMRLAGIFGIVLIILSLFLFILFFFIQSSGSENGSVIFGIIFLLILFVMIILGLFFLYGFVKMGKATSSKLLSFAAKSLMVIIIFLVVVNIIIGLIVFFWVGSFINASKDLGNAAANPIDYQIQPLENLNTQSILDMLGMSTIGLGSTLGTEFFILAAVALLFILFIIIVMFLFFIGLIRVGKQVKFAKPAGIFGILWLLFFIISPIVFIVFISFDPLLLISSPEIFLIIGTSLGIVFSILSLIMVLLESLALFNCSAKFEGH
jgi:hypothetical protein